MPPSTTKDTLASTLLSRAHSPTSTARILSEKIQTRPLHLKPTTSTPSARSARHHARLAKARQARRRSKPAPLSAREKRALGIYDLPATERKHALYAPLHRMWIAYVQEVLGFSNSSGSGAVVSGAAAAKLASADFHGADVEVVRSRCVSRVGVRGIVVKDTKFTFEVVTRADELKVLPKEHTVFRFEIPPLPESEPEQERERELHESTMAAAAEGDGAADAAAGAAAQDTAKVKNLVFELHGDQFQHRAVDRANKKFKPHHLPDL